MKFSLVGSFNLADGYLGGAKALRQLGHEVDFIPAHFYKAEHKKLHIPMIIADIKAQNPDVILWWRAETLTDRELENVRNSVDGKFIIYSWDDPYQWESHAEMPFKCKHFDIAFTCCYGSVADYERYGCKAVYCLPGFDPELHFPENDESFACDVSLVCTNLYDGNLLTGHSHFSRKDICDAIVEHCPDIDFRLYGDKGFESLYPNNYRGWIPFNESHKVFYNSKVNICTHIRPDGYMYINERVCQILGSGGLLLVDYVSGLDKVLKFPSECIVFDYPGKVLNKLNFARKLTSILDTYKDFELTKQNGHNKAMSRLTWTNWAQTILNSLGA